MNISLFNLDLYYKAYPPEGSLSLSQYIYIYGTLQDILYN